MSEVLAQYYKIYINGKELDEDRYSMINQVVFEDNASGSDLLTIDVNDPDFIYINDNIFIEEATVKFEGGFLGRSRVMFEGYISMIDISFPDTGSPTLTIHCMDNTHIMNRIKKKRTWNNVTRSEVATQIFREYGFKAVIDSSSKREESITQNNETDIDLIIKLAGEEIDSYLVYVERGTGYYVRKKLLDSPQDVLDYRDGNFKLINFEPRINKETKQVEVRKSNVNLKDKKVDKAKANDNTSRTVQGTSPQSTDRRNDEPSWQYGGNGTWIRG